MFRYSQRVNRVCSNFNRHYAFLKPFAQQRMRSATPETSRMDRVVSMVNKSFHQHPRESLVGMLGMEIMSIYGTHKLLVLAGIAVPAEFALAFAMSRPLRRLRFPVEVLGAAGLCRMIPQLRQVQISSVISGAVPSSFRATWQNNETLRVGGEKLSSIIDKYGVAYFISARWLGVTVVLSFYTGILYGLDVSGMLARYGIEEFGTVLGTWAAAVSTSAVLYPCTIVCGAGLAPFLSYFAKFGRRFFLK